MNVLDEKRSSPELRGYVKERIRKMQDVMARKGVDVTILMRPENVFYFSNFNPILISHVPYFILTRDDAFLLVHCIRHDHAVNEGAVDKVLCYGKWGATQAVAMDAMDAMRELLGGGPLTVGVEGDYASMNFLDRLKTKLQVKGYGGYRPGRCGPAAHQGPPRDQDVPHLRRAGGPGCHPGHRGPGRAAPARLRPPLRDSTPCATAGMRSISSTRCPASPTRRPPTSTPSWSGACPTSGSTTAVTAPPATSPCPAHLTMPMSWARIAGYNVENERTVIVGHVNEERTRAYDAMLRARDNIFRMLRPGAIFEDLYFAAMKEYEDAGFGSILPGRCGHGDGPVHPRVPLRHQGQQGPPGSRHDPHGGARPDERRAGRGAQQRHSAHHRGRVRVFDQLPPGQDHHQKRLNLTGPPLLEAGRELDAGARERNKKGAVIS